ncbi:hypothetical protein LSH36_59g08041 [Paralvinella palmiformis]|uniref:Uncharacterized protein n=1 Tax=Paralvinella palmiformis TaxID=53620 RepID=A0AAD9NEZ9_9ANNE|nr:hypothetical protein LSH36_59g08041 [Paralvinella palmiformis]
MTFSQLLYFKPVHYMYIWQIMVVCLFSV